MSAVTPEVLNGLQKFGLITEEQANEELAQWEKEWDEEWADIRWWDALAEIAWKQYSSRWEKLKEAGFAPFIWKQDWIREQRGW